MKRVTILFCAVLLLVSGCSVVNIEKQTMDEIVSSVFSNNSKLKTISLKGYSYYLPQGVILKKSYSQNSIFLSKNRKMYMYVDMVSYYNKVENDYKKNANVYYSLPIDINGKKGYLEINDTEKGYFIEFMYNYTKIEAYSNEKDLKNTITKLAYILNSIRFNDSVIESLIGENSLSYSEENFNIFTPNGEESNFLDYVEKYDEGRTTGRDEDFVDLDEDLE